MLLDTRLLRRRSTRLRARDYSSPGNYYVTLCTEDRRLLFGDVVGGVMHLNDLGRAAERFWNEIPLHFPHAELDEHIVMPNHVHGIIRIMSREWRPTPEPIRVIGMPIVPGLTIIGANGSIVGANDHLPLHPAHLPLHPAHLPLQPRMLPRRPSTHPKLFPMGHGTSRTIGSMIRGFKIGVTRWAGMHAGVLVVWQRNHHDHVIRNRRSLERVRAYIRNNPTNWARDRHNPDRRAS